MGNRNFDFSCKGLLVDTGDGEDFDALYARMLKAVNTSGPVALVNKRKMAPRR